MTLTTWMARVLADRDGASPGARYAAPRLCLTCGAWTLVGLDDDTLAFTARVDPTPLTPAGELACVLAGRPTYDLIRRGTRRVLDARDDHALRARPPAVPGARYDVLPAHRCHQPVPGTSAAAPTVTRTPVLAPSSVRVSF
jgi:hypothetical protein